MLATRWLCRFPQRAYIRDPLLSSKFYFSSSLCTSTARVEAKLTNYDRWSELEVSVRGLAPPSCQSNALTSTVCTTANAKLGFANFMEILLSY
jgi:hypothetical protein